MRKQDRPPGQYRQGTRPYRPPAARQQGARPYANTPNPRPRHDFVYRNPPANQRRRKRRSRAPAFMMLTVAAVIAVVVGLRLHDYHMARQENAGLPDSTVASAATEAPVAIEPTAPTDAAPVAIAPDATATPVPSPTPEPFYSEKVRGYQRQNSDTVAYIDVAGTAIQYPVVQAKDNDYYMTHSFAKRNRAAGAIFLDAWNSGRFTDFNTVVYGHNMKDGSMFSDLREYRRKSFLAEHKYIEVTLLNSKRTYKVFAAYVVEDGFDFRGFTYTTETEQASFIKRILKRSEISTNATATAEDTILTLVTCTSGSQEWYWVVHAVLVEEITTKE